MASTVRAQRTRRRLLGASVGLSGATVLAAACGPLGSGRPPEDRGAQQRTQINVWAFDNPVWRARVEVWNQEHPAIQAELSPIGDTVWGNEKMAAAVAAGQGPDVAVQGRQQLRQFAVRGFFSSLNSVFSRDRLKREDYFKDQFEESTWVGVIYGLPLNTDVRVFYWNKRMFLDAGLDPERPPRTWTELVDYGLRLNRFRSDGTPEQYGWLPYWGNARLWMFGLLNGGEYVSADARRVLWDDPKIVDALQFVVDYYDKARGYERSLEFLGGFQGTAQNPFATGRVAMTSFDDRGAQVFYNFPELQFGATHYPSPPTGRRASWSCAWSAVIPTTNQHKLEEAWQFIKWSVTDAYFVEAEQGLQVARRDWALQNLPGDVVYIPALISHVPTLNKVADKYRPQMQPQVQRNFDLLLEALKTSRGCGLMAGPVGGIAWNEIENAAQEAMRRQKTPRDALQERKNLVQLELDKLWADWEAQQKKKS
jgi:multiple sugar transport system substrate-binding protein